VTDHEPRDEQAGAPGGGPPPPPPPAERRDPSGTTGWQAPGGEPAGPPPTGTSALAPPTGASSSPPTDATSPGPPTPPPPPPEALRSPRTPTRPRPSLADAIVLPIWVLAGQLLGGLLIVPVLIVQGFDVGVSDEALIGVTVVLGWTFVAVGIWLWLKYRRSWRPEWRIGHAPMATWKAVAAGIGGALGGYVLMQIVVVSIAALTGAEPPEQEIFELLSDPLLAWVIGATAVLAAPIIEEIVFRGVVMDVFLRRWGWWPSAIGQAAIFSAIHIETLTSATMFFTLAMLGFIFAWLRRVTGSLVAPIVAHLVFNLISLVLSLAVGA
jgi:uncharacterized protein